MYLFLTINLLLALGLLAWVQTLRVKLRQLASATDALLAELGAQPTALRAELAQVKPMLLTVEILNPMELAHIESRFAGTFGSLTPKLVQQIVYRRARTLMVVELEKFHVKAEVRIHAGA